MTFRFNETKDFPTDRRDSDIWYGLILFKDGIEAECISFTSSKTDKTELLEKITELNSSKERYLIIGIWRGMYKADAFVLDPIVLLKKFKTGAL